MIIHTRPLGRGCSLIPCCKWGNPQDASQPLLTPLPSTKLMTNWTPTLAEDHCPTLTPPHPTVLQLLVSQCRSWRECSGPHVHTCICFLGPPNTLSSWVCPHHGLGVCMRAGIGEAAGRLCKLGWVRVRHTGKTADRVERALTLSRNLCCNPRAQILTSKRLRTRVRAKHPTHG